jgi:hypothetical protein
MMPRINTALILAGFFVFLTVPFVSFHLVTPNTVHEVIDNPEQASLLDSKLRGIMGSEITNLVLQNKLTEAFDVANQSILDKYTLSDDQLRQITTLMKANRLNQETVDSLFLGEENEFIRTAFSNYGNWLYG